MQSVAATDKTSKRRGLCSAVNMSGYGVGPGGGMSAGGGDTDSLTRRLREAERARADAERAHADALAQLRSAQRSPLDSLNVEQLQSRARELEKKAALETVRCEELQLELSATLRARGASSGGSWSAPPAQPASEIERIMAKIEQDNRILAELEHTRSTTHGMQSSGSNQALGEFHSPTPSPLPHSYTSTTGHVAICQSNTMPTLSSLHATGQFTVPSSNSVAYSISAHNPTSYSNPVSAYSTNSYLTNTHQVTFTNPVTAPLVNNIGQISNTLAGLQSNLQNITGNMSAMSLGSALTGPTLTGTMAGSGLSGCLNNVQTSLSGGLTSTLGGIQSTLTGALSNPLGNLTGATQLSALNTSLTGTSAYGTTGTYTNPLLSSGLGTNTMNIKLKPLDEIDLGIGRFGTTTTGVGRVATPVTPHQPSWSLGLDSQFGPDRLGGMDSGFSHDRNQRALSRILPNSGLEMDVRNTHYMNGGAPAEGQVDMLDIPGKGRCCVYIARFSYDPPEIESAEGELSICAGDYLLVWGPPDPNASMLDAELLDGRRGLVPANFVQRLVGEDLLEFHQAVVATLRDVDESATTAVSDLSLSRDVARLSEVADISEGPEDDDNAELFFSSLVPAPRQLTLERQLNKSVLIGWTAPEGVQQANIESYHVYVDGVLKTTVKATERTRALVEGVDSNRPHRISVRSVTVTRRTSRDAACTMVIGRDTANMGPTCVRATGVTCSQAVISWLPANSNHQHVVCVNNVEVRTVKPGVYRHTITGLSPSTQYRVTVRAKHLRAGPPSGIPIEEAPGAYTDFRTLPKGLPDPPNEIMVEAGPQDGTLLVTWQPVLRPPASGPVTGYAVYADGKKVTDVDSPTGDHALIDIGKLIGLNPKCVTVRTKSRDSQSSDSAPTPIPPAVLRGVASRLPRGPHSMPNQTGVPYRGPQRPQPYQHQQQVIEHDENLSDKEIFPTSNRHDQHAAQQSGIPAIEITKEGAAELGSEDEDASRRRPQQQPSQPAQASQQQSGQPYPSTQAYHGTQQPPYQQAGQFQSNQPTQYTSQPQQYQNPPPRNHHERGRPPNPHQQQTQQGAMQYGPRGAPPSGPRGPQPGPRHPQQGHPQSKRSRYFIALFDYDPATMSPNPESCDEELPFSEGDTIKVWGDKDADGFYWGECRGRRGYVPHNMVMEVSEQEATGQATAAKPRDRWTDAYATQPVRRMVALYDYDPQELSPNVDADRQRLQAELSFQTGQIIHVYGDMDDDGFYMAEIDGVRGLVPSNFLTDANDQYASAGQTSQGVAGGVGGMGGVAGPRGAGGPLAGAGAGRGRGGSAGAAPGPGARGPPPPPRDNVAPAPRNHHRKADACPLPPSQLDHNTCASNPEQANSQARARGAVIAQPASTIARTSAGNAGTPTVQSPGTGTVGTPLGSAGAAAVPGVSTAISNVSPARRAGPAVVPAPAAQPLPAAQPVPTSQPNLMQKFSEMTAPGGDILSKGKELIFMKFGLGGK
ncbi:peripheral-type benzodiazepine receptor-associated protein 1 isoform X6 [Galleria mellonella]|uniref:Peripheral-type benzodiazepine receptor-associated protein 1 isoform X6 n=1 Tax=Galleria mellonella TaxID=7137 RepID=A0ABM3MKL4_GALME|nr:peripheral-type benzodiazepine receptor-associated protein 1 isoform X6 [Galleria mellonella]